MGELGGNGDRPIMSAVVASDATTWELAELLQVVIRVGVMLLRGGTMSWRVEQAMHRIAKALGADRLDVYVTLTGITASIHRGQQHYTQIMRVTSIGVDMNRVSAVEYLSMHLPPDITPQQVMAQLDGIEQLRPVYPMPVVVGAVAIACGAFALIQGGGWPEWLAAAVGAGIGQRVRLQLRQWKLNVLPLTVMCAAISSLCCFLALQGVRFAEGRAGLLSPFTQAALLSSVLFLVPGMPLITAALDLVRFDLVSGLSRIAYASLLLCSIAIGLMVSLVVVRFSIL
jgi:uncharacterized membrane protein YjjP (DUF1212 family)